MYLLLHLICCAKNGVYDKLPTFTPVTHKTLVHVQAGSYTVATEGDAEVQKTMCKWAALHSAGMIALMIINNQPVACGGHIIGSLLAVVLGMNA